MYPVQEEASLKGHQRGYSNRRRDWEVYFAMERQVFLRSLLTAKDNTDENFNCLQIKFYCNVCTMQIPLIQ